MTLPNIQYWNAVVFGNPSALSTTLATGLSLDPETLAGLQTSLGALQMGLEKENALPDFKASLAMLEMGQKSGDVVATKGPLIQIGKVLETMGKGAYVKGLNRGRVFLLGPFGRFASTRKIREQIVEVLAGKPNPASLFSEASDQTVLTLWNAAIQFRDAHLIHELYLDDLE
ncbi:MAG: hypothetical protein U1D33_00855, partial [bacterium]|nr:hypothetical protein [bacterium]